LEAVQFESFLSLENFAFLQDHRISGEVVFPAAAYAKMALAAGQQVFSDKSVSLQELQLERPLFLDAKVPNRVYTILRQEESQTYSFQILSRKERQEDSFKQDPWTLHAQGKLSARDSENSKFLSVLLSELQSRFLQEIEVPKFYQSLKETGLDYGPQFQLIQR